MEQTLAILKPDCLQNKNAGKVLDMISAAGFKIRALRMTRMTQPVAESFYAEHQGKDFFSGLIKYITEGPIIVAVLEKENAITEWRELMGKTNPEEAAEGTIRKRFAENVRRNVVHGSDSPDNARREIFFFFTETNLLQSCE